MANKVRARARITGRVQGVCFRIETCRAVTDINVSGWVRNRADGSVEAVFEGSQNDVNTALEWCRKGPPISKVDGVEIDWEPYTGEFDSFEITY